MRRQSFLQRILELNIAISMQNWSIFVSNRKNIIGLAFKDADWKDNNHVHVRVASVMAILMSQFSIDTQPLMAPLETHVAPDEGVTQETKRLLTTLPLIRRCGSNVAKN